MKLECDVLVAGGGTAGLAAAVTASRQGARVVLVERNGFLGGMGTSALVHTLCGLYVVREDGQLEVANEGVPLEVLERLKSNGGAEGSVRMGRVQVVPHDPWALALLADEMTQECGSALQVWLHAELTGVAGGDAEGWEVHGISRGSCWEVRARAVVDATGDAVLSRMAGARIMQTEPERLQRPAYVVKLGGVGHGLLDENGRLRLAHGIARAVKTGRLPEEALGTGFRRAVRCGEGFMTIDLAAGGGGYDPLSVQVLSGMERLGRHTASRLVEWLRSEVDGFHHCWVSAWPTRAGVRESCRVEGEYVLSVEDVLEGRTFEDGVVRIGWPVELREKATGPRWQFAQAGAVGQIPLRALRSASYKSLFAAGRCLSASHEALGAVRVMGTCLATGEAAGRAAVKMLDGRASL